MIYLNNDLIHIESFPNGESKIQLPLSNMEENNVLSLRYENDADLFRLYLVKKELDDLSIQANHLNLRYMPYSRMDRRQGDEVFSLKHVAEFINSMKFQSVTVSEPHSDVTPALLNHCSVQDMSAHLFYHQIKDFDNDKDVLVFPDAGAQKRYTSQIKAKNILVGHKHRDWETGDILSFELVGNVPVEGRAVIIDDLSSYGGTFMHTGNKLKEMGFKEIYLVVAHAEKSILQRGLLDEESPIDKVITTNSIISAADLTWKASSYREKIVIRPLLPFD